MKHNTASVRICILIGLCFFWSGSGYLTWMYHLLDFYPSTSVDIFTEVIGYVFQVCGLLLFSLYIKKKQGNFPTIQVLTVIFTADFACLVLSVLSTHGVASLLFGLLMNLFHGCVAAVYLTKLVIEVPQQHIGVVFGLGYALGSIGSWGLSLIGSGNFLKNNGALIVYFAFILLSLLILSIPCEKTDLPSDEAATFLPLKKSVALLSGIAILMLCCTKNMSFYFPLSDLLQASVSLELSRTFYAVGLIIAGIVNDKNRRIGAICCIASLVCPFAILALRNSLESSFIFWSLSYFFFGFFAVYRITLFADIARLSTHYLYLAGFGLIWGRLGDVTGALIGIQLSNNMLLLVLCNSVFFVITVFLFFSLYRNVYIPIIPEERDESTLLEDFEKLYSLSPREAEVFQLIVKGFSNTEISENLYISENTVKFHIKNILKKTGCPNRIALISLYKNN